MCDLLIFLHHQATRMGLKKQLATHKAALLREHRKREQAPRVNPSIDLAMYS